MWLAINTVASCACHWVAFAPRQPVKTFWPHGHCVGAEIGAKADTERNRLGCLSANGVGVVIGLALEGVGEDISMVEIM